MLRETRTSQKNSTVLMCVASITEQTNNGTDGRWCEVMIKLSQF